MTVAAYPLHWPTGWPRAKRRERARFSTQARGRATYLSVADARERLSAELERLRAQHMTLSTNLELRLDGQPRSGQTDPADPGAALYFQLGGKDIALACDKWDRVADNIAALAKHIEAMRGMDRWGVGSISQAFAGYEALPAPEQWWQVLGVSPTASRSEIQFAFRDRAKNAHPDAGGSDHAMARLNAARDEGLRQAGD